MELKIEYLPKEDLKPYEKNAKLHPAEQIEQIKNSIREFGFNDPIAIWHENEIIEGHGRLLAALDMPEIETVPVIRLDDLTDEQRRAYMLAHNKLTMNTDFDFDLLSAELSAITNIDMSDFGFDSFDEDEDDEPIEIVEDEVPEEVENRCVLGDIWQLGDHRLLCGDSTSIDQVERLMDGSAADLVVTDPPYNMGYEGAGNSKDRASKRILNDNMSDEKFKEFIDDVYTCYWTFMKDGASIYVFYKELGGGVFITEMSASGLTFKQELIWVKNQLVLGGSKYQSMYEPCLMGCKGKSIKKWNGGRKQHSVIEMIDFMDEDELRAVIKDLLADEEPDIIRERKNLVNDLHPTMKPIRLLAKFIENSSDRDDIVMDLFGGSGSTLIACEQLRRRCYMAELDPHYCDVIIQRWENFTGETAVRLNV